MAMLKRLRRQFSGGALSSSSSSSGQSGSGRRLLPRLGSRSSLTSMDKSGGRQAHNQNHNRQQQQNRPVKVDAHSHDAAGRRTLDRLITARQWERVRQLLSNDKGRDYIKSVSVLLDDASDDSNMESAIGYTYRHASTTTSSGNSPRKFISIFHHVVLSDPPPDILSDLVHLVGVSQLLRRDDIRPYYPVGYGLKNKRRSRASRRSSNSARVAHEGAAWTPLHTAVAFCCVGDRDDLNDESARSNTANTSTVGGTCFRGTSADPNPGPRVDPSLVRVLLRHFPALPSITCGRTSVTPLMIEAAKGPRANMSLCKRMVDACPTSILIKDSEDRTAVEYALGSENLRLYRNLHHLFNDEMQKMNGLESRKRMAHSLMAGGGGDSGSGVVEFGPGDVRMRRDGSLTGLHSRAAREAAEMVAREEELEAEEAEAEGEGVIDEGGRQQEDATGGAPKRGERKRSSGSRSSTRSSTSAAA